MMSLSKFTYSLLCTLANKTELSSVEHYNILAYVRYDNK